MLFSSWSHFFSLLNISYNTDSVLFSIQFHLLHPKTWSGQPPCGHLCSLPFNLSLSCWIAIHFCPWSHAMNAIHIHSCRPQTIRLSRLKRVSVSVVALVVLFLLHLSHLRIFFSHIYVLSFLYLLTGVEGHWPLALIVKSFRFLFFEQTQFAGVCCALCGTSSSVRQLDSGYNNMCACVHW